MNKEDIGPLIIVISFVIFMAAIIIFGVKTGIPYSCKDVYFNLPVYVVEICEKHGNESQAFKSLLEEKDFVWSDQVGKRKN